jgi:hypothetical protein
MSLNALRDEGGVLGHDLRDGLVRINHAELIRKLQLRGKPPAALRAAGVSFDTLAKIKRGEPVQTRILHKITVQLGQWPELEHASDLIKRVG